MYFGTGSSGSGHGHWTGSGGSHWVGPTGGAWTHFSAHGGLPPRSSGGHYRYHGHDFERFRAGIYRWPEGRHYRHYAVGAIFPQIFWNPDYYITDYADWDLDPPPPDCQWVRYGPDLVLFNLDTAEVIEVIPDAFDEDDEGD